MREVQIAVLMTCYNRREKTLACLDALSNQVLNNETKLNVYLVDDGSTDGTAGAVRATYPEVKVIKGNGSLFWNGGMRLAFSEALKVDYDYYLWLNDDTMIEPNAVDKLLNTHRYLEGQGKSNSIVAGAVQDPTSGTLTYGGLVRPSRLRRLKFERVEVAGEPRECETMHGNCVLIPREVASRVGNLDSAFTHGAGDQDYGLRARKLGCAVWIAPGFVGKCSWNLASDNWRKTELSFREQIKNVNQPKGLPFREWKVYAKRHAGSLWFIYWLSPYIRLFVRTLSRRSMS